MELAHMKEFFYNFNVVSLPNVVYLGIVNYGEVQSSEKDGFQYRFMSNGEEIILSIDNGNDYYIQNQLAHGYVYDLKIENNIVTEAILAKPTAKGEFMEISDTQVVSGEAGKKTLLNFISTAFAPVGNTLYVYGGGWNWQDDAGSIQASSVGISPYWGDFFKKHDAEFAYIQNENPRASYYPHGKYNAYYFAGLDCSGYVGWAVYNTMHESDNEEDYVTKSTNQAKTLSIQFGYGNWTQANLEPEYWKPGDIFSMQGHVWVSLGTCTDGSMLILHSTPSLSKAGSPGGGVQLSAIGENLECEAYQLAQTYMQIYYPKWTERYPVVLKSFDDYINLGNSDYTGKFSWHISEEGLLDSENVYNMKPNEILELLFTDKEME